MIFNTIHRRLFIRIAPVLLATILCIGIGAFFTARHEINTVYDAQLIDNANVLWNLTIHEVKEEAAKEGISPRKVDDIDLSIGNQLALNDQADDYADARMFRIWKSRALLMYSNTAIPDSIPIQPTGFSWLRYNKDVWRIYTLPLPGEPYTIEVGEKADLRNALVDNIILGLALPLLLLVPVTSLLLWLGIGSGLGQIAALIGQIRSRSPDILRPLDMKDMPVELLPLGDSINQLLGKLERSLAAEKNFVDQAAHYLRTPLATARLQLQMLEKTELRGEQELLIQRLLLSNDRGTKLVSQMLTSARLNQQPVAPRPVSLSQTLSSVMADLGALAVKKGIDMSLDGPEDAVITSDEMLLSLLFSNLIENAIKYAPADSKVRVRISPAAGAWEISIADHGPGIPPGLRQAVFERFYRIDAPAVEGSGLGLAIVADIIKKLSGEITLGAPEDGTGLLVCVRLPAQT